MDAVLGFLHRVLTHKALQSDRYSFYCLPTVSVIWLLVSMTIVLLRGGRHMIAKVIQIPVIGMCITNSMDVAHDS